MTYNNIESLEASQPTDDNEAKVAMGRMDAVATESKMQTYTTLKEELGLLQARYERMRKSFLRADQRIEDAGEYLKNEIANGNMDAEDVTELAAILGVELTEESEVTITLKVRVTHAIGKGDDISEMDFDIEVDSSSFNDDLELVVDDFDIDKVDVSTQ